MLANVTVGNTNDVADGDVTSIAALIATPGADGISLREAILTANADAAADTIDFSVSGTIQLTNVGHVGEIAINNIVTINGPGTNLLTIQAFAGSGAVGDGARIFRLDDGSAATFKDVFISGLTLTGGDVAQDGGAIESFENLTVTESVITGNTAGDDGAGIKAEGGSLSLIGSTISNNTSAGPYAQGGGIYARDVNVSIMGSTISGNQVLGAVADGGGLFFRDSVGSTVLEVVDSLITGNMADRNGGGMYVFDGQTVSVTGSTVSNNQAAGASGGGGILAIANITLTDSTVGGNIAVGSGGGIRSQGDVSLVQSIVSDNRTSGIGADGGGIRARGDVTLTDSTVSGNSTSGDGAKGGGIYAPALFGGTVTLTNSTVSGNSTSGFRAYGGGVYAYAIVVSDSIISGNGTTGDEALGGGLSADDTITVTNSTISGNSTAGRQARGGGLEGFFVTITGSNVTDNSTAGRQAHGGGIRGVIVTLNESTVSGNRTIGNYANGGGIYSNGSLMLTDSAVTSNSTAGDYATGGGIYARVGSMTLTRSTVSGNGTTGDKAPGGGIWTNADSATLTESTVHGNSTSGFDSDGGGMLIAPASMTVTVTDSTISENGTAGSYADGGGIYSARNVTLTRSTVRENSTSGFRAKGGGIATQNVMPSVVLALNESTISGNSTAGFAAEGGGINAGGDLTVASSTISGNSTTGEAARGGGIWMYGGATLHYSTVADNHANGYAAQGGGVAGGTSVEIRSTILAGNTAGSTNPDLLPGSGALTVDYSLIGDNAGTTLVEAQTPDANGNLIGSSAGGGIIDPQLGPLGDYGGPTLTHVLLVGSPAIDAGDPAAEAGMGGVPAFDQRGDPFGRVVDGDAVPGARIDMGAVENETVFFLVDTLVDENDGAGMGTGTSLRDAIAAASLVTGKPVILFDPLLTAAGPATIELVLGQLEIGHEMTVKGPGANVLTIDARGNSRVFLVDDFNVASQLDVMISGLTITGGNADREGGGISSGENLTVADSVITGNQAGRGGGIYHRTHYLTVLRSTVSGNTAVGGPVVGSGGGILNFGDAAILDSTLSGNTAPTGGGLYMLAFLPDTTLVRNSTISGNEASIAGGGIYNFFGHMIVEHSTITNNTAPAGKGGGVGTLAQSSYTLTELRSTIVAGNVGSDVFYDVLGNNTFASLGYNLIGIGDGTAAFTLPGDQIGVTNPMLGPLADNGGPTLTHALLVGSPAIDAGDPAAMAGVGGVPMYDQRGAPFERVLGARIDIGAFEADPLPPPALPGDYNQNGKVDAADYVLWRKTLNQFVAQYSGADGSGDGIIGQEDYGVWTANFGQTLGAGSEAGGESSVESQESRAKVDVRSHETRAQRPGGVARPESVTGVATAAIATPFAEPQGMPPTEIGERRGLRASVERQETARWRDDALVAWVASPRAGYGGDETREAGVTESFARRERDDDARESVFDAVDSVFETLLVGVSGA